MAKLRIKQVRSGNGQTKRQKDTLRALGLGKPHRTVEKDDSPQIRGMISKVNHLVEVEEIG